MSNSGIVAIGAYLPRLRLSRRAMAQAHAWANPGLAAMGNGTRAICAHDEDSITMAVAAARAALGTVTASRVDALLFASTSLPFADRQNSTLIGEALSLRDDLHTADFTGSQRAGTSALLHALQSHEETSLVVAADKHVTKPGSTHEFVAGDGAAALITGSTHLLARFVGAHTISMDLVDHYRSPNSPFDYRLEERWVREAGHLQVIPRTIAALLTKVDVPASRIKLLAVAGVDHRVAGSIAVQCGVSVEAVVDTLRQDCGDTGNAHALLLLTRALQRAEPDDFILVAGFGQGCDTLLFQATPDVARARELAGVDAALKGGIADENYFRYLACTGLVEIDWGLRAERDNRTAFSSFLRHRRTVTGFVGGRCTACGALQFPKSRACANPLCRQVGALVDEPFAGKRGEVKSYTEDWLAHTLNPPFMYGNVRFEGGAVVMMELTDFEPGQLRVGDPLRMVFRIKDRDVVRGFHRYFWKAAPAATGAAPGHGED